MQTQIERHPTEYPNSKPQTRHVTKNMENLRNYHSREEPQETQQQNIMQCPGWDILEQKEDIR